MKINRQNLSMAIVLVLCSSLAVGVPIWNIAHALSADTRNSIIPPGGETTPCTWDNFQDSGKFLGRNCQTGDITYKESSAGQLFVDENQSNIVRFWESGTWNFCAPTGFCAPNGGISDNNVVGVSDYGIYGSTIFACSNPSCVAYSVGNQNANDAIYHADNITLHDVTIDGGGLTTSACLSITTALNVFVSHVILQNCLELATGCLRLTNWNSNQIISKNIWLDHVSGVRCKITLSGANNGALDHSTFTGMPPADTVNVLVDFSKGDIPPTASNNLGQFCFCFNTIAGWTVKGIFAGFQAISNDTIGWNTISGAAGFMTTVDTAGAVYFNGLDVEGNYYSQSTGSMLFQYGNFLTIMNNHWTVDSTPANGATGLSVSPDASSLANQPGQPNHVAILDNTIRKWGGIGMELNFTNGIVEGNQVYNGNQANGNANSNAGILIDKGDKNVLISGNDIVSDVNSGAGQSRPVNYAGAAKNITLSQNFFFYQAFGGAQGAGIFFSVTADPTFRAFDNYGFNPLGKITTPFINGASMGMCGNAAAPNASTDYKVCGTPIEITSTGGTGVSITIKDQSGNTVASGLATLTAQYLPIAFQLNFGAFSVAPTVTVVAN
jgi:hypothetical protein